MNVSNNNLIQNMSNRMESPIGAQLISHMFSKTKDLHNFHTLEGLVEAGTITKAKAVRIMMGKETYTGISFSKEFVKLSKKVLKTELYNMRRESEEKTGAKFQHFLKVLQNSENKVLSAAGNKLFNTSGSGQLKVNEPQNLKVDHTELNEKLNRANSQKTELQTELDKTKSNNETLKTTLRSEYQKKQTEQSTARLAKITELQTELDKTKLYNTKQQEELDIVNSKNKKLHIKNSKRAEVQTEQSTARLAKITELQKELNKTKSDNTKQQEELDKTKLYNTKQQRELSNQIYNNLMLNRELDSKSREKNSRKELEKKLKI